MKCENCTSSIIGPNEVVHDPDLVEYGGWCRACKKSVCVDCFDEKAQRCVECVATNKLRSAGRVAEL